MRLLTWRFTPFPLYILAYPPPLSPGYRSPTPSKRRRTAAAVSMGMRSPKKGSSSSTTKRSSSYRFNNWWVCLSRSPCQAGDIYWPCLCVFLCVCLCLRVRLWAVYSYTGLLLCCPTASLCGGVVWCGVVRESCVRVCIWCLMTSAPFLSVTRPSPPAGTATRPRSGGQGTVGAICNRRPSHRVAVTPACCCGCGRAARRTARMCVYG